MLALLSMSDMAFDKNRQAKLFTLQTIAQGSIQEELSTPTIDLEKYLAQKVRQAEERVWKWKLGAFSRTPDGRILYVELSVVY
jgi:hypothetical protein